jgi:hypothetical protein
MGLFLVILNIFTENMLYERSEIIEFTLLVPTKGIAIKKPPCHEKTLSIGKIDREILTSVR